MGVSALSQSSLRRSGGEGDQAESLVEGPTGAVRPSTTLRAVPLPIRFAAGRIK